ncbi:hypothetical protein PF002_g22713 [Phytophthora fragariae]|uniref:Uncharacterized protein n=1 Tax=Phytophthora fragariae TaxID=53985 RepID=A0A6A3I4R3_9STRA|nr:hypothetical protein PF011_g23767 [Phytophthora fragariae]KAE9197538.1 hypothetical protein PF002_g22713 [Phytophthora fragariae]
MASPELAGAALGASCALGVCRARHRALDLGRLLLQLVQDALRVFVALGLG